jgi:molybdopterin-guanine dinucleotide biosynthesis protein A
MIDTNDITAIILAGGRGSRMGGRDKGLVTLSDRPMIAHVLDALKPQVGKIIISANRNLSRYASFGFPVISDELEGYQGPLAGILAGMKHVDTPWVLYAPCDAPALPRDLARRLAQALDRQPAELAVVHDGANLQPAFALMPAHIGSDLEDYLNRGERRLRQWCMEHHLALADFSDMPECFANINDEGEMRQLLDSGLVKQASAE